MNLNKAFVLGRMTADPQLRTTASGQPVATFSVATDRVWTDKAGAKQKEAEFHNVVSWGRQAEIASQFLKKGALVLIEGRLQTRTWQDKQGQSRRTTEIICERLQLGPKTAGGVTSSFSPATGGGAVSSSSPAAGKSSDFDFPESAATEEIPIINVDEEFDAKSEDLPF